MKIVVIGGGAMGSIYAGHLSKNNEVYLVDTNKDLIEQINKEGVLIEEDGVVNKYHPNGVISSEGIENVDLIILFVKAIYSNVALESNRSIIGNNTILMTLQNGAGHEDLLRKYVSDENIVIGTTEDNGNVKSLGYVRRGGTGVTNIGSLDVDITDKLNKIKEIFDESGFKVKIHDNIQKLIWDKLLINASLSAVTGILQVDMGYIAQNEYALEMTEMLIDEIVETGNSMGLNFDKKQVLEKVKATSLSNLNGKTSIRQDIAAGRKTEVDTISGAVCKKAEENGINVPVSKFVVNMVHALENK